MKQKIQEACPRCARKAFDGVIRLECVQPLLEGVLAPRGLDGKAECHDCAAAGTLLRLRAAPTWDAARIAVGNDRQEQLRLPGAPMGLVLMGITKPNKPGDLKRHHEWLRAVGLMGGGL